MRYCYYCRCKYRNLNMSVKGLYVTKFVLKGGNVCSQVKLCGGGCKFGYDVFCCYFCHIAEVAGAIFAKIGHGGLTVWTKN